MTQRRIGKENKGGKGPVGTRRPGEGVAFEPGSADRIGSLHEIDTNFPYHLPLRHI